MSLKQLRLDRGLTQKEMAQFLDCTQVTYFRYESGEREPTIDQLKKLSDFFGVSIDRLLDHEQKEALDLSRYEIELVKAARQADERARIDALALLRMNASACSKATIVQ